MNDSSCIRSFDYRQRIYQNQNLNRSPKEKDREKADSQGTLTGKRNEKRSQVV
jgi:hypothetical protein